MLNVQYSCGLGQSYLFDLILSATRTLNRYGRFPSYQGVKVTACIQKSCDFLHMPSPHN